MMQPNLFEQPDYQDEYRELLQKSWNDSLQIIKDRGEIPPWWESDFLLQEDEIRLLQTIGDGYQEGRKIITEYGEGLSRYVSTITRDAGFIAEVNAVAVVRRCLNLGYIERVVTGATSTLYVADEGEWRLDAVMADRYWESEESA